METPRHVFSTYSLYEKFRKVFIQDTEEFKHMDGLQSSVVPERDEEEQVQQMSQEERVWQIFNLLEYE